LHFIAETAIGSSGGAMMQKSRTITLQFGAESSQWSAEREFFPLVCGFCNTPIETESSLCASLAPPAQSGSAESSGLLGREAYIPKVYELVELNTKRACVRAAAKKTTACTWEKAARLRVRKINSIKRTQFKNNAGDIHHYILCQIGQHAF
jgi:hypothetical protein